MYFHVKCEKLKELQFSRGAYNQTKRGFKASNIPISSILGETQSYARFSLPSREVLFVVGLYISFTSLFFGSV